MSDIRRRLSLLVLVGGSVLSTAIFAILLIIAVMKGLVLLGIISSIEIIAFFPIIFTLIKEVIKKIFSK